MENGGTLMPRPTFSELHLAQMRAGATHDERIGPDFPVGFVYFEEPNYEDQQVRVGYVSNPATEADNPTAHPVQRFGPYVFAANWGEPTYFHLIAAWDYLVAHEVGAFAVVAEAAPDTVRWMNGYGGENFILADRRLLTVAAEKERNKALKKRSGLTAV